MSYNTALLHQALRWAQSGGDDVVLDIRTWADPPEGPIRRTCVGGWALIQAGARFIWTPHPVSRIPTVLHCELPDAIVPVSLGAASVLGVNEYESLILFDLNEEAHQKRIMDFLEHLCRRSSFSRPNLDQNEVESWSTAWSERHPDLLL